MASPDLNAGSDPVIREAVSLLTGLECKDKSLAIQSQKDEADINTILDRFGITGELPVSRRVPLAISDFSDGDVDYRTCVELVNAGKRSFDSLPAKVRAAFSNDPGAFVDFAVDPANIEQMRIWGLAPAAVVQPAAAADEAPVAS